MRYVFIALANNAQNAPGEQENRIFQTISTLYENRTDVVIVLIKLYL